jgi:hypothetical protein
VHDIESTGRPEKRTDVGKACQSAVKEYAAHESGTSGSVRRGSPVPLAQAEADSLLGMAKEFLDDDPLEFCQTQPMNNERWLRSLDRREQFILTVERGRRRRIRLKYQTRARKVIVLARMELNGPAHWNPPESPYRPGERLDGTHVHLYRENFEDRIAYAIPDVPGLMARDLGNGLMCLEDFLRFCGVGRWPNIQLTL